MRPAEQGVEAIVEVTQRPYPPFDAEPMFERHAGHLETHVLFRGQRHPVAITA